MTGILLKQRQGVWKGPLKKVKVILKNELNKLNIFNAKATGIFLQAYLIR